MEEREVTNIGENKDKKILSLRGRKRQDYSTGRSTGLRQKKRQPSQ